MTPRRYLSTHPFAKFLRERGATALQLYGVRFLPVGEFRDWQVRPGKGWPPHLMSHLRPWTTLHWLVIDDPPHSRDTREAWNYLADHFNQFAVANARDQERQAKAVARALVVRKSKVAERNDFIRARLKTGAAPKKVAGELVTKGYAAISDSQIRKIGNAKS